MTPEGPDTAQHASTAASPTRAALWIHGAKVTILPRRAPVGNSGPIRGHTLAIYPHPLASADRPAEELFERSEHLQPFLPDRWHEIFDGVLEPGGRACHALANLSEAEATSIGRALGLTEILFWDGRRAHLLPCEPSASHPPEMRQEDGS